jgi:hypothetical protein
MGKLNLPESYIFAGKHYGPGEVEIEDEAAFTAIKAKMAAKAEAEAAGESAPAHEPVAPAKDAKK